MDQVTPQLNARQELPVQIYLLLPQLQLLAQLHHGLRGGRDLGAPGEDSLPSSDGDRDVDCLDQYSLSLRYFCITSAVTAGQIILSGSHKKYISLKGDWGWYNSQGKE